MQLYVDETMGKENINYQQNGLLWWPISKSPDSFCGVIAELLITLNGGNHISLHRVSFCFFAKFDAFSCIIK